VVSSLDQALGKAAASAENRRQPTTDDQQRRERQRALAVSALDPHSGSLRPVLKTADNRQPTTSNDASASER
jgi:hypothetical protein